MKPVEKTTSRSELKNLYQEIGGEERLSLILRDFYRRMATDILVGYFFMGKDPDEVAEKQMEFLLKAMGQSDTYSGKSPARAHQQLPPILTGHFDRRLKLLEETLRDHGLQESSIQVWLRFENSFRVAIVS